MKSIELLHKLTAIALSCTFCWSGEILQVNSEDITFELPERYDMREEAPELITSVKEQIGGSCWAYEAIGCIESDLIRKGYADNSIDLSESHLMWFTLGRDAPTDPADLRYGEGNNLGKDAYNHGSDEFHTFASLAVWQGVVLEEDVPDASGLPIMDESLRYQSVAHLRNGERFPNDPQIIKTRIIERGPVGASFIFKSQTLTEQNGYYFPENVAGSGGWHGIMIVGWDDHYSKDNFKYTPPDDGAWIIKNSYGTDYGENGYLYISYYESTLTKFVQFDMEPVTNYGAVHTYACSDLTRNNTSSGNAFVCANVFEAKEDETIAAIGFFTYEPNQEYDVSIYELNADYKNPRDGELVRVLKGTLPYEGFHTLDLDESWKADKGTKYSVIIKNPLVKGQRMFHDSECSRQGVSYFTTYNKDYEQEWNDCYNCHVGDPPIYVYTAYEGEEIDPFIRNNLGTPLDDITDPLIRQNLADEYDSNGNGYISDEELASISGVPYDINGDGRVNVVDLTLLKQAVLGTQKEYCGYHWYLADCNKNNCLDHEDVQMMLHFLI